MTVMNLYCCGGTGINIGKKLLGMTNSPGFAEIVPYLIDTSKSNDKGTDHALFENKIYRLEEADGNGKLRTNNYSSISDSINEILHYFKPSEDINVFVHSASGGSGSVIGPLLVSELMSRDKNVIVLLVGGCNSRIETENTIKTIKSYDSISNKYNKPVACYYIENGQNGFSMNQVNECVMSYINSLAMAYSGKNERLDKSDLYNFINYNKVAGFKPSVTFLDIQYNKYETSKEFPILTMLTLSTDGEIKDFDYIVEYRADGIYSDDITTDKEDLKTTFIAMISGKFNNIIKALNEKLDNYNKVKNVIKHNGIIESNDMDKVNDDGLIL